MFWTKNALFWYLWARIFLKICYISNQHSRVFLIVTFCQKKKKNHKFLNSGPKIPYFGIFGLDFSKNIYFDFWNRNSQIFLIEKILENFRNNDAQIRLIANFSQNRKMSKFSTENAIFETSWDRILENYWHIWN